MTVLPLATKVRVPAGTREQIATRLIFLLTGIGMASWAPLIPYVKARLNIDDASLGLLLLCVGTGSIIAMPLTGPLATRYGCRTVITSASIVTVLILPSLILAGSIPVLAFCLAVFGASIGTIDVAMNIQAVMVERDSGRTMMSGFHGLFSLGGIVGAGGVSLLLTAGLPLFACTLIVSVLLALLITRAYRGLLTYGNEKEGRAPMFVLPRGLVLFIGALCFSLFLTEGAVLDWSALFLITHKNTAVTHAGLGYTIFSVAMAASRLSGDAVVQRLGGMRIMLLGGGLAAGGFVVAVLAPGPLFSLIGFLMIGLGASNIVPVLFTAAGRQPSMPSSLAISAISSLGYAGILTGPALIGFVSHLSSLNVAFLLLALLMLFVSASAWVAKR